MSVQHTEYYEFIGVSPSASPTEIKRAYYKKALECHPDKNPDNEEAKATFQRLAHIYAVLSVPAKRADYDYYGEDEDEDCGEEADEEVGIEQHVELTVEQLQAFIAALGGGVTSSASEIKKNVDFETEMNPASVYTEEILTGEIERAIKCSVSKLYFERKGIKELPPAIGSIPGLKELILEGNKLSSLPEEIAQLKNLQKLFLKANQFKEFPNIVCSIVSLEDLTFDQNQITTIPDEISNLTELKKLSFFANKLEAVPASLGQLTNLKKLDLELNYIKKMPKELEPIFHIITLDPTVKIPPTIKTPVAPSKEDKIAAALKSKRKPKAKAPTKKRKRTFESEQPKKKPKK